MKKFRLIYRAVGSTDSASILNSSLTTLAILTGNPRNANVFTHYTDTYMYTDINIHISCQGKKNREKYFFMFPYKSWIQFPSLVCPKLPSTDIAPDERK